MGNGWQRIVVGAMTAVAPLAATLAIGIATAHADTYAQHGGAGSGKSDGSGSSVQHRPGWQNGVDLAARQDHVPVPRSGNSSEQGQ